MTAGHRMDHAPSAVSRTDRARAWVASLRENFRTVILATVSPAGEPEASVAGAALAADGSFLIFVSGLAAHTRHLLATGRASVLLAEDEAATAQPLARRRLSFPCAAVAIPRSDPAYTPGQQLLRERLGPAFDLVSGLGDFELIRLTPRTGRLVAGFGETYEVDSGDWTKFSAPIRPRG